MIIQPKTPLMIDRKLEDEDVEVLAVNLEDEMLMVRIMKDIGLARIERFLSQDGQHDVPKEHAHWAEFAVGEKLFTIPLGSNIGDPVGIEAE